MDQRIAMQKNCPYLFDELIKSFLLEAVLEGDFCGVIWALKGDVEDETVFAQRRTDAARNARDDFAPLERVNHYLIGFN